jgi:hypothetical protein
MLFKLFHVEIERVVIEEQIQKFPEHEITPTKKYKQTTLRWSPKSEISQGTESRVDQMDRYIQSQMPSSKRLKTPESPQEIKFDILKSKKRKNNFSESPKKKTKHSSSGSMKQKKIEDFRFSPVSVVSDSDVETPTKKILEIHSFKPKLKPKKLFESSPEETSVPLFGSSSLFQDERIPLKQVNGIKEIFKVKETKSTPTFKFDSKRLREDDLDSKESASPKKKLYSEKEIDQLLESYKHDPTVRTPKKSSASFSIGGNFNSPISAGKTQKTPERKSSMKKNSVSSKTVKKQNKRIHSVVPNKSK